MAPRLEVRHLQMIQAIAETGRVTEAAEMLGLTPSALSHRIREAERRLDVTLYTRLHKRLRMTPAAEHLAHVAGRVLADMERAEEDVWRTSRGVVHVVRLAIEAYSSYHWLPGFLSFLQNAAPDVDIQVMAGASREPLQSLSNRHIDLAIMSGEIARPGATAVPLFDDEQLFIMAPGHRLAGRDFVEVSDLAMEDLITYSKTPGTDGEIGQMLRNGDSTKGRSVTVELPEVIVELVAAGQGSSVLAGWAVETAVRAGRIRAARVSREGVVSSWSAVIRSEDNEPGNPIRTVASLLSNWCSRTGHGFRPAPD